MLAPDDPRHGTANGYQNLGCRCDRCREAHRVAHLEYTHRAGRHRPYAVYLAERYPGPPPHGTESRYGNPHRCRCDECRAAGAAGRRARRHRQEQAA